MKAENAFASPHLANLYLNNNRYFMLHSLPAFQSPHLGAGYFQGNNISPPPTYTQFIIAIIATVGFGYCIFNIYICLQPPTEVNQHPNERDTNDQRIGV